MVISKTFTAPWHKTEILAKISTERYSGSLIDRFNEDISHNKDVNGMFVNSFQGAIFLNLNFQRLALNIKREEDSESNEIVIASIENIPVFRNGYKSKNCTPRIFTINTCGFDSIFSIFTSLYFDDPNYREYTELFVGRSNFSELIKKYFGTFNAKLDPN